MFGHSKFEGLKIISAGRKFQFLEVMGTNVLANEVVRHFSNSTAKGCWESVKRVVRAKHALRGITDYQLHNDGQSDEIIKTFK